MIVDSPNRHFSIFRVHSKKLNISKQGLGHLILKVCIFIILPQKLCYYCYPYFQCTHSEIKVKEKRIWVTALFSKFTKSKRVACVRVKIIFKIQMTNNWFYYYTNIKLSHFQNTLYLDLKRPPFCVGWIVMLDLRHCVLVHFPPISSALSPGKIDICFKKECFLCRYWCAKFFCFICIGYNNIALLWYFWDTPYIVYLCTHDLCTYVDHMKCLKHLFHIIELVLFSIF